MERRGAALLRKTLVANFRELRQGEVHGRRESLHSHGPNGPGPQARGRSIARYCALERWAKPIAILARIIHECLRKHSKGHAIKVVQDVPMPDVDGPS